jgi:beta-glucanase (GH16 family)
MSLLNDPETPGHYLNAHIGTQGHFDFYHGYAEAKMRFFPYHGMHASFWLQSAGPYEPGAPEIDVVEYFGTHNPDRLAGVNVFNNVYYRAAAGGPVLNKKIVTNSNDFGAKWWREFHQYGVKWTDAGYEFFIDRKSVGVIDGVADDVSKYLVLSNLVRDYEYPDLADHPLESYKTSVEYVRVWQ